MKRRRKGLNEYVIFAFAGIIFLALEFLVHRAVGFVNDDLWYSTNLATDHEPLTGIKDIIEGQIWHYFNWGGRSITHTLLQLILMTGELCADILNTLVSILLAFVIYKVSGCHRITFMLTGLSMLIAFNYAPEMNIFWESGAANYLYSTVWIFTFFYMYLRELSGEEKEKIKGIEFWILPLGLIAGWSNENMGPASFCMALGIFIYTIARKKKFKFWMLEGALTSLAGSIILLLAPGNFVRKAYSSAVTIQDKIKVRFDGMMESTFEYYLPVLILVISLTVIYLVLLKERLSAQQVAVLIYAVLAHGAMALSPTYPSRATFGVLAILIVYILSVLQSIYSKYVSYKKYIYMLEGVCYLYGCLKLVSMLIFPSF